MVKSIVLALAMLCGANAFTPLVLGNKRLAAGLRSTPTGTGPSLDYNPEVYMGCYFTYLIGNRSTV